VSAALAGKVAVVSGASRGIGQAIALRFAAEGAKVALLGRTESTRRTDMEGSLDEGVARIRAAGGEAIALRFDIGDPALDKRACLAEAEQAFGRAPDILIHSAAAPREWGPDWYMRFADTDFETFLAAVKTNVWGGWDLAKAAVPGMRKNGAGWIVFISSQQAAPRPHPTQPSRFRMGGGCVYGGTKAFIDRIVTGAALELYAENIAVNSLAPTGLVETPNSRLIGGAPGSEAMEVFVEATLALCVAPPRSMTSRVVHTMPLLAELKRPVYTLDGSRLFDGWQPDREDSRKHLKNYLAALGH
jgi:NAD(P)-dependent dehydrogenase (short-subunit alcohol dehydrogenase family)